MQTRPEPRPGAAAATPRPPAARLRADTGDAAPAYPRPDPRAPPQPPIRARRPRAIPGSPERCARLRQRYGSRTLTCAAATPEQREPGGGWGADARAARARAVRRRPRAPGSPAGRPGRTGPRQEYLDAFEDDVFGGGRATRDSAGSRARRPDPTAAGPDTAGRGRRRPGTAPGAPGEPRRTGQFDERRPSRAAPSRTDDAARSRPPRRSRPARDPQTKKGGKGRASTGVAAAAVTTVLAFVVAGQVTGGEPGDDGAAGTPTRAGGAVRRRARPPRPSDGRAWHRAADAQGAAPLSYEEKMARPSRWTRTSRARASSRAVKARREGSGQAARSCATGWTSRRDFRWTASCSRRPCTRP